MGFFPLSFFFFSKGWVQKSGGGGGGVRISAEEATRAPAPCLVLSLHASLPYDWLEGGFQPAPHLRIFRSDYGLDMRRRAALIRCTSPHTQVIVSDEGRSFFLSFFFWRGARGQQPSLHSQWSHYSNSIRTRLVEMISRGTVYHDRP